MRIELAEMSAEKAKFDQVVLALENDLLQLSRTLSETQAELGTVTSALASSEAECARLRTAVKESEDEARALASDAADAGKRAAALEAEVSALHRKMADMAVESADTTSSLQRRALGAEAELQELQVTVDKLKIRVASDSGRAVLKTPSSKARTDFSHTCSSSFVELRLRAAL